MIKNKTRVNSKKNKKRRMKLKAAKKVSKCKVKKLSLRI